MGETWPHIGPRELRQLWERYAPRFLRLDDVDFELPRVREQFLRWLVATGVDLGDPLSPSKTKERVKLQEVSLARRDGSAEAAVSMSLGAQSATCRSIGEFEPNSILKLAAAATLDAVHELLPQFGFGLENTFVEKARSDSIAISVVREDRPVVLPGLVGAAAVVTTPHEAVVRATLDAINRQMTLGRTSREL